MHIYPVHLPPTLGEPSIFQEQQGYIVSTTVDHSSHRVAWETTGPLPKFLMHAEHWHMLTTTEDGKTKCETIEVFRGLLSYPIRFIVERNLNLGFQAIAEGLKSRAEGN